MSEFPIYSLRIFGHEIFPMKLFACLFLSLLSFSVSAQCLLKHIPLNERLEQSEVIVEVIFESSYSFEEERSGRILTSNSLRISKLYKGDLESTHQTRIQVINQGGQLYDRMEMVNPSLQFEPGDIGLLLLNSPDIETINGQKQEVFRPSYGPLSFIRYNVYAGSAHDHMGDFSSIVNDLYPYLESELSKPASFESVLINRGRAKSSPEIDSFSPDTVEGGNGNILTIKGSFFGSNPGSVRFANADDGGATERQYSGALYIKTWTDTLIECVVPQKAGTGKFRVLDANQLDVQSTTSLVVKYARLELTSTDPNNNSKLYRPVLDADNGSGGITWKFNSDFFQNDAAVNSFLGAMESWRCATLVNYQVDTVNATSTDTVGRDGIHTVMWQNANQSISSGALGVCFSQWSGCFDTKTKDWHWWLNDVDIVFDDQLSNNRTWNFGHGQPTSGQYDFQSVALHEIGHSIQLGHINDPNGVMHFSIRNGEEKRQLVSSVDVAGANVIINESLSGSDCNNYNAMTLIDQGKCKLLNIEYPEPEFSITPDTACSNDTFLLVSSANEKSSLRWILPLGTTVVDSSLGQDSIWVLLPKGTTLQIGLYARLGSVEDSVVFSDRVLVYEGIEIGGRKIDGVSCFGKSDGATQFIFNAGKSPYFVYFPALGRNGNPLTGLAPGEYEIEISDDNGCEISEQVEITMPDSLSLTSGTSPSWGGLGKGAAWVKVTGGTPPYTYRWDDPNQSTMDSLTQLAGGTYQVAVSDANDCSKSIELFVDELVGVDARASHFTLFPNPVEDRLQFRGEKSIQAITIYDIQGKKVLERTGHPAVLNISHLKRGLYLVQIQLAHSLEHHRIVVQ